ncbi:hypothetical protein SNEBB_009392 [Seison nebaliae]|nr:hypothetical protein SNEBB_009392 [Seison nebaliae]
MSLICVILILISKNSSNIFCSLRNFCYHNFLSINYLNPINFLLTESAYNQHLISITGGIILLRFPNDSIRFNPYFFCQSTNLFTPYMTQVRFSRNIDNIVYDTLLEDEYEEESLKWEIKREIGNKPIILENIQQPLNLKNHNLYIMTSIQGPTLAQYAVQGQPLPMTIIYICSEDADGSRRTSLENVENTTSAKYTSETIKSRNKINIYLIIFGSCLTAFTLLEYLIFAKLCKRWQI